MRKLEGLTSHFYLLTYFDVPSIVINPRRVVAFAAALVCALLLLQYAHRRQPFILLWAAGWLLIAPAMLVIAGGYASPVVAREAVGLSQPLLCTAVLFLWSADVFRHTGFVQPRRLKLLAVVGLWFLLAPLVFGTGAVLTRSVLCLAAGADRT